MMKKIFVIFALSGILAACTVGGGVSASGGSNGVGLDVGDWIWYSLLIMKSAVSLIFILHLNLFIVRMRTPCHR